VDVEVRLKLNSTKTFCEHWSVSYDYGAYLSIQGYFCNSSLKFKLSHSAILVLLYF